MSESLQRGSQHIFSICPLQSMQGSHSTQESPWADVHVKFVTVWYEDWYLLICCNLETRETKCLFLYQKKTTNFTVNIFTTGKSISVN